MRDSGFRFQVSGFSLALLCSAALAQGPLDPPGAPAPAMKTLDQVEPRRPISALPYDIWDSGSYYVTTNLTGTAGTNGISVYVGDVSIDLGGHTLVGVAGAFGGIYSGERIENVSVVNGALRGWDSYGVGLVFASNCVVSDLRASYNGFAGIFLGNGAAVSRCTLYRNDIGAAVGRGSVIEHCLALGSTNRGYAVDDHCVIRNCTALNGGIGFFVNHDCTIQNNLAVSNSVGFSTVVGRRSRYEDNHVTRNTIGFNLSSGSSNIVVRNTATGNGTDYNLGAANDIGPIGTAAASTSPWANIQF